MTDGVVTTCAKPDPSGFRANSHGLRGFRAMGDRFAELLGSSPCIHPRVFHERSAHCATKEFASTSCQIGGPAHIRVCGSRPAVMTLMHVSGAYGSALLLESPLEDVFDASFQLKPSAGIPRTCSRIRPGALGNSVARFISRYQTVVPVRTALYEDNLQLSHRGLAQTVEPARHRARPT